MAIKRLDPKARFRVVSSTDDAILLETPEELKNEDGSTKPTRFENFLEKLDMSELKFKEGEKPTVFVIRALTNFELADINEKFFIFDPATKKVKNSNPTKMLMEMFKIGCLGIEKEDKSLEPVTLDDIEFSVAIEIGGMINLIGTLGKNLKKQ